MKESDKIVPASLYNSKIRVFYRFGNKIINEIGLYQCVFGEHKSFLYIIIGKKNVFLSLDDIQRIEILEINPEAKKITFNDTFEYQ